MGTTGLRKQYERLDRTQLGAPSICRKMRLTFMPQKASATEVIISRSCCRLRALLTRCKNNPSYPVPQKMKECFCSDPSEASLSIGKADSHSVCCFHFTLSLIFTIGPSRLLLSNLSLVRAGSHGLVLALNPGRRLIDGRRVRPKRFRRHSLREVRSNVMP